MDNKKVKVLNIILLIDFILYILTNLLIFKYSSSTLCSLFYLIVRDVIIFLFSIFLYVHFCNSKLSSIILFPEINRKIVKNSIIIGISLYFISTGSNIIFRNIFKFTLKETVYLNNMYDLYNLGFSFLLYLLVHTLFIELFFRCVLSDAFKFLKYKPKLILTSCIFAVFFFGPSQLFYGFILGVLLMSFYNKIGNVGAVVIASWVTNSLNYLFKIIGNKLIKESVMYAWVVNSKDLFINFLFPLIIVLISLIVYSTYKDKIKVKRFLKGLKEGNVTVVNFKRDVVNIFDVYFLLFLVFAFFMMTFSYVFL